MAGIGVGLNNIPDSNSDKRDLASDREIPNPQRRRFARNALGGGAVMLSLGNRAAWGQTIGCMSIATINSFDPNTQMFMSAPGARPEHNESLASEIHRLGVAPDYLGTDGTYTTCQDDANPEGVCLILGPSCPSP